MSDHHPHLSLRLPRLSYPNNIINAYRLYICSAQSNWVDDIQNRTYRFSLTHRNKKPASNKLTLVCNIADIQATTASDGAHWRKPPRPPQSPQPPQYKCSKRTKSKIHTRKIHSIGYNHWELEIHVWVCGGRQKERIRWGERTRHVEHFYQYISNSAPTYSSATATRLEWSSALLRSSMEHSVVCVSLYMLLPDELLD